MTKQEFIEQSYGEHWESVKDFVDENGWTQKKSLILNFKSVDYESKSVENQNNTYKYRPSSLKGIETNNGWIKIESEKDLPKEHMSVFLFDSIDGIGVGSWLGG